MKRLTFSLAALALASLLLPQSAHATARVWANSGTDYNAGSSWTGGTAPGADDVALFDVAAVTQPNLSASLTNAGLRFSTVGASGYNITSSAGAVLTLNGVSTTGTTGTTTASAAAIRGSNTSGTNTVSASLNLASSTGTSSFVQVAGGTLIVNGAISSSGTVALRLANSATGGGVIQINGTNTYSGGTLVDSAGLTVVVGNDSALGSGAFTINNTATLQAGGGSRTLSNAVVFAGNTTLSGTNAFTFNGAVTSSGSNTRTLTVSNTGGATFAGSVFLQEAAATGRTLTINGASAVNITGAVQDGGTGPATLRYSGSSTLTLSNSSNTYSGGTQITIAGGTIIANGDGTLGTGNVSLTATSVTLTLQNGIVNNYIADTANLSIVSGVTVNLNYTGTDSISQLVFNGAALAPGTYGSASSGAQFALAEFMGNGQLLVAIPEPSTYMLLGVGGLLCVQQFRRRRNKS